MATMLRSGMAAVRDDPALHRSMRDWRHAFHRDPEIGFGEVRTAARVAQLLSDWGVAVETGVAGTGVVGIIDGMRGPGRSIALRADMDALPIVEANGFEHASANPGLMHACGHDGHTAMLLGAARHLAADPDFFGRVVLIFQPAEEPLTSGARAMIADGVLDRYSFDAIYAVHNYPPLQPGQGAIRAGGFMASADSYAIEVVGRGGHGATPELAISPVPAACEIALALPRIVTQSVSSLEPCVVNTTMVSAGGAPNVIPERATLGGTVRAFDEETRRFVAGEIERIAIHVASAHRCKATVDYTRGHPATVNAPAQAASAATVLRSLFGSDNVIDPHPPIMGSEDFSYFLQQRPGAYALLGQGGSAMVHDPAYDFNDDILPLGAAYFVGIVALELGGE